MYNLNIFGTTGLPRTDIPDSEIAKLDKVQQLPAFMDVMTTWPDTLEADAAMIETEKAKRRAIADLKKKMEAHENLIPQRSFYDEWKRTVAKIPEPEPDPNLARKVAASLKLVEKAHMALEQCERDIVAAKEASKQKRRAFADALKAWSRVDGSPKSVGDLIKARAKTETEQKLANIAKGMPADYAVAQQSTVGDSHLDRFKAGQKGGHSADYGYGRNAMRGATLPKVASER